MSIQAMAWALKQALETHPPARHVLLCLSNYADDDGRSAFPSNATLVSDTGLSERAVRDNLRRLEENGLIERDNPAIVAAKIGRPDHRPTCYRICIRGAAVAPRDPERGANTPPNGGQDGGQQLPPILKKTNKEPPEEGSDLFDKQVIPYQAIVNLYNLLMVDLPKVRELTAKRKSAIEAVWKAGRHRRTEEFWRSYFEECADDKFYNGAGPYRNGHEGWKPDFDFLMRGDVVTKVYERAMDRLERSQVKA